MIPATLQHAATAAPHFLLNHLWQSSWFAVAMGGLTLLFRRNQARIRFGLWLAASIKFLIPFSLLVVLGNLVSGPRASTTAPPAFYTVIQQAGQPFMDASQATRPFTQSGHSLALLPFAVGVLWFFGFASVTAIWCTRWLRVLAVARKAQPLHEGREVDLLRDLEFINRMRKPVPLLLSRVSMEPGIFGIFHSILLWPEGISAQLSNPQLKSILAHELWHVRRRDNLTAALHMLVEAIFWFHPAVWWIGGQLIDERERACDEQVLHSGNQPEVYAESILRACKFCVEAPISCVSGVAGSDLKRRIMRIMTAQSGKKLSIGGKLTLAAIAITAVAAPVAFGIFNAPHVSAQEIQPAIVPGAAFDQVSIRPSDPASDKSSMRIEPGVFTQENTSVTALIAFAYGIHEYQVVGAPAWASSDRFDIEAHWKEDSHGKTPIVDSVADTNIAPPPPPPPPPGSVAIGLGPGKLQDKVKTLLAERFNLKLTSESRDLPVYELVVASGGARLTPAASMPASAVAGKAFPMVTVRSGFNGSDGNLVVTNASAAVLADLLSQDLHRKVVDKTGLTGFYDLTVHWPHGQTSAEEVSAAIEEQIGLKLESGQGPVKVLVINQVEKPAAD
jgi:bla regulator protein blaR1